MSLESLFNSVIHSKPFSGLILPWVRERLLMNQRCPPPRLRPPGTIQAGCPFHLPGCHCLTGASCSHARLLLHQTGNVDADPGVPATLLTEAHLGKWKNSWIGITILILITYRSLIMMYSKIFGYQHSWSKYSNSTIFEVIWSVQLLPGLGGHHRSPSRREPARRQPPSSSSPFWSSREERQFPLSARVKSCFLGKTVPLSS